MLEIVITMGLSAAFLYATILVVAWAIHGRQAGQRERALFVRWAAFGALIIAGITGWVAAGIAAAVYAVEFWRGAWAGGSLMLWLGYVPLLVWIVRAARQQQAAVKRRQANKHQHPAPVRRRGCLRLCAIRNLTVRHGLPTGLRRAAAESRPVIWFSKL